jgi:hypothetical protein
MALEPGPNGSYRIAHMSDNPGLEIPRVTMDYLKYQIYSLGADGDYITPDSPPDMIVQRKTLEETNKVGFRKGLPPEMSAQIRKYLGGKRRRTKKSKKSRKRKSRKSGKRVK